MVSREVSNDDCFGTDCEGFRFTGEFSYFDPTPNQVDTLVLCDPSRITANNRAGCADGASFFMEMPPSRTLHIPPPEDPHILFARASVAGWDLTLDATYCLPDDSGRRCASEGDRWVISAGEISWNSGHGEAAHGQITFNAAEPTVLGLLGIGLLGLVCGRRR